MEAKIPRFRIHEAGLAIRHAVLQAEELEEAFRVSGPGATEGEAGGR